MNKKIDENQVLEMLQEGFSNKIIAGRLGCSTKQIGRIKNNFENKLQTKFIKDNSLKDQDVENARRKVYVIAGFSFQAIATRFGISRQAVYKSTE